MDSTFFNEKLGINLLVAKNDCSLFSKFYKFTNFDFAFFTFQKIHYFIVQNLQASNYYFHLKVFGFNVATPNLQLYTKSTTITPIFPHKYILYI